MPILGRKASILPNPVSEHANNKSKTHTPRRGLIRTQGYRDLTYGSGVNSHSLRKEKNANDSKAASFTSTMSLLRGTPHASLMRRAYFYDHFSNNLVLINQERFGRSMRPLQRCLDLDEIACAHAASMANRCQLFLMVGNSDELKELLHAEEAGININRGTSIRRMHASAMRDRRLPSRNILSSKFTHFGMGTHMSSKDGNLYLVQLFRGPQEDTNTRRAEQQ